MQRETDGFVSTEELLSFWPSRAGSLGITEKPLHTLHSENSRFDKNLQFCFRKGLSL
jgi:hypothetical protein